MNQDNYLNLPRLRQFYNKLKNIFVTKDEIVDIKGDKGDRGEQGVSVVSVEQTTFSTENDGINIIEVTLSDETSFSFNVKNGSKGDKGNKGDKGDAGINATTTAVATISENGLMSKDMVSRLNSVTVEVVQSTEPTTQQNGDYWLQSY